VDDIAAQGIQTVVLQSGEDAGMDPRWLARIVEEIKGRHGMSVTLSVGEWPKPEYALWRSAGADRFLLKIESSDRELYESLHRARYPFFPAERFRHDRHRAFPAASADAAG
jgi:biotin synthase